MNPCAKCNVAPRTSSSAYCRGCWNAYQSTYRRRRYAEEAEYREKIKLAARLRRYGISPEHYTQMLEDQDGACAICQRTPTERELGVDHCHKTGRIRGLLCADCNGAIGMLQEDPAIMRRAIRYLAIFDN